VFSQLKAEDFDHLKLIGRGAFGEVWLVRRKDTSEVLALKRIKKAHLIEKNQVESILVEREVLKGTQSPWIVHLHCRYVFCAKQNKKTNSSVLFVVFTMCRICILPWSTCRAATFARCWPSQSSARSKQSTKQLSCLFVVPSNQNARFYAAEMFLAVATLHRWGFSHRDLVRRTVSCCFVVFFADILCFWQKLRRFWWLWLFWCFNLFLKTNKKGCCVCVCLFVYQLFLLVCLNL
jgi:hypothetical protein